MFKGGVYQRRLTKLAALLIGMTTAVEAQAASLTRTSAFEYDSATGLLTKEVIEPDNSNLCLVTTYTYDSYGNKTAATTRNCNGASGEAAAPVGDAVIASRTASVAYDARGQFPTSTNNALNQSEIRTFDPKWGNVLSLTGPNGLTTTWQYDNFGRKVLETRTDGTKLQWSYQYCQGVNGGTAACPTIGGAAGAWLVQVTPQRADGTQNGPSTRTYYDSLNREIRSETQGYDGTGTSTVIYKDTQYDSLLRPYKTSRPYYAGQSAYWVTASYDSLGRVLSQTNADGAVTTTVYNGLSVTVTNSRSQTRTSVKNSQGQLASVTDAMGQTVNYAYDPFGKLVQTLDTLGNKTLLSYDLRGRKTGMVDPDMGNWTYAYDALGQLIRQTNANNQSITFIYDKLGRMTQRIEADLISKWFYDSYKGGGTCAKGIGKLCQAETDTGYNRTHSYDSLGRPTQTVTTIDANYIVGVSYDANGRVQSQTYPGGVSVSYVYTSLGYLKEVRDSISNALYWQANSLDAEGHLLQQSYGNGIVTQQTYNPANGRLTGILAGAGNGVQNLTYAYDTLGNIVSRNDANQNLAENFVYDNLNRMTNATVNSNGAGIVTTSYTYNAIGNIQSRSDVGSYSYPPSGAGSVRPHAISRLDLAAGGYRTYAYDANGNLNTETQYDAGGNVMSDKGRVQVQTSFDMPMSIGAYGYSSAFAYGPEHQRVRQVSSSPSGTTIYLNSDNEGGLFYEKDTRVDSSIEQRSFITAGGATVAVIKQVTTNGATVTSVKYFHRDNLGSTAAITDESGNVVERLAYEPFGKRRFADGNLDPNNTISPINTERGFTNHEHLDELGLVHMNGRIYDPLIGRFTSADPNVPEPDSLQSFNRYSYVQNSPLNGIDPSGYDDWGVVIWDGGGGSTAGGGVIVWDGGVISGGWGGGGSSGGGSGGSVPAPKRSAIKVAAAMPGFGMASYPSMLQQYHAYQVSPGSGLTASQGLHGVLAAGSFWPSAIGSGFAVAESILYLSEGNTTDAGITFIAAAVGIVSDAGGVRAVLATAKEAKAVLGAERLSAKVAEPLVTKKAGQLGADGERAVRSVFDIGDKPKSIPMNGRGRVPDGLKPGESISEVKNVARLSFTRQLRDYFDYAHANGLRFDLYVRQNTELSGPLLSAERNGLINIIRYLPE